MIQLPGVIACSSGLGLYTMMQPDKLISVHSVMAKARDDRKKERRWSVFFQLLG